MRAGEQVIVFQISMCVAAKIVYSTLLLDSALNRILFELGGEVSLIDRTATTKVC